MYGYYGGRPQSTGNAVPPSVERYSQRLPLQRHQIDACAAEKCLPVAEMGRAIRTLACELTAVAPE
jgi:hypothetical protein